MARCNSCGLFASVEQQEPELTVDVDEATGEVTGEVTLTLTTGCCSDEAGSASVEVTLEPEVKHTKACEGPQMELDGEDATETDRFQTTDRHGKPIKNYRYQRHFYGADVTVGVVCANCHAEGSATDLFEEQASSFEGW